MQRLVYVSGAPGAGKSTLAGPLAAELGYALLGKDIIKETLHGVLGPPDLDRARSRELGAASMELLWALAARSPQVLIEANFRPYSDYERTDRLLAVTDRPRSCAATAGCSSRRTGRYRVPFESAQRPRARDRVSPGSRAAPNAPRSCRSPGRCDARA